MVKPTAAAEIANPGFGEPEQEGPGGFARLSRDSGVYAFGSIVGKGVGLVMLPILTRWLTVAEYGRMDVLSTLGSACISGFLLGIDVAVTRLFFDAASIRERRQLLGTWLVLTGAVVLPVGFGLIILSADIARLLFGAEGDSTAVAYVGLMTIFGTYQVVALTVLRAIRRPGTYALLSAGVLLLNAILAVLLLRSGADHVAAIMAALAASLGIGGLVGLWTVRDSVIGAPSRRCAVALLRVGLPLAPAVLATWAAEFFNRTILLTSAGTQQVAVFAVGLRIASIASLVVAGFQLAWYPHAFAMGSSQVALDRLAVEARRIVVGVAAIATLVALAAPAIVVLATGSGYQASVAVVGFSLLGVVANATFLVASLPRAMAMTMGAIGAASLVGIVVGVIANFLLAPAMGAQGTAFAISLGPVIATSVLMIAGGRGPILRIPIRRLGLTVGSLGFIIIVATHTSASESPVATACLAGATVGVLVAEGTLLDGMRYLTRRWRSRAGPAA